MVCSAFGSVSAARVVGCVSRRAGCAGMRRCHIQIVRRSDECCQRAVRGLYPRFSVGVFCSVLINFSVRLSRKRHLRNEEAAGE